MSNRQGLTLVEVVAVTVIVAIVAGIAFMAISGRVKGVAKRAVVASDMRQIVMALNIYRTDNDDGFPSNWKSIGYYGINRKDKFSKGFPPRDVVYDKPPEYDVSYHTPECAAPPKSWPGMLLFRQFIADYYSKPRFNVLDIDLTPAVQFLPICQRGTYGRYPLSYLKDGKLRTVSVSNMKHLSVNLAGTVSFQWEPAWDLEIPFGGYPSGDRRNYDQEHP